jgi:NADPH2:quinone reductase
VNSIRVHKTGGPDVNIEAIGVNFIEIYQREGLYTVQRPFTPGSEAAGVVRALGSGVTEFKVGDRVVSQSMRGAYASRALVAADRAVKIPDGVTSKIAAAVFLQGLTAHYLTSSTFPLKHGDSCLVHAAAGGVGLLLCQIAKRRGAFVIGTASTQEKLDLAREAGADETINYTTRDFVTEVKRITGDAGVAVVYDSVGRTTFEGSLNSLRRRGMMALFGQSSGAVPPIDPQVLNRKGSLFLTRPTLNDYVATRDELVQRSNELLGLVNDGSLKVRIGAEFPLVRAADAHRALASRKTTGKVVLAP